MKNKLIAYIEICIVLVFLLVCFADSSFSEESSPQFLYETHVNNGIQNYKQGLYKEAKDSFWNAINLFPEKPDAYINLATIHISEKNPEGAKKLLLRAKNIAQKDYAQLDIIFYNLGICFYQTKSYKKAIKYFQKALEIRPDFSEAVYYIGISYDKLGHKNKGLSEIRKAREMFEKEGRAEYKNKAEEYLDILNDKKRTECDAQKKSTILQKKETTSQKKIPKVEKGKTSSQQSPSPKGNRGNFGGGSFEYPP